MKFSYAECYEKLYIVIDEELYEISEVKQDAYPIEHILVYYKKDGNYERCYQDFDYNVFSEKELTKMKWDII
jgi:hypothetical protein